MTENTNPAITLADLQEILAYIDLASSRGAFRGAELAPVGANYNKLMNFIQTAQQPVNQTPIEPEAQV